ncbi:MAG: tyrosine-type recombinase/integrase [Xanthobacteraceae bacterium]
MRHGTKQRVIRRGPLGVRGPAADPDEGGAIMKLTERKIEKLAAEHGRKDRLVFDDEQRGLAVRVTASGGRTYLCQYTLHGHKWRVPLGSCSAVALFKARQAAAAVMGDVAKGRNPAADRKEAAAVERARRTRNRLTLRVLIEDWNHLRLAGKRPSYAAEAVRALHYAFSDHLDDAAEDLDRAAVVRALDGLTRRRRRKDRGAEKPKGAAMTGRTAAYGRAAFAWALKRGAVRVNPFADLAIDKSIAKRERVLTDAEIAEIWRGTGDAASPYGTIIRLLILTGQRRGEVAGVRWDEISDDLATWTLPGERTKNGAAHTVPLSAAAQDVLRAVLPEDANERRASGGLVLPGAAGTPFAGWSKAKRTLDKVIMNARAKSAAAVGTSPAPLVPWSVHDLRRTVATGLQRLGVRLEVTEALLNHISGSRGGIAGVYQRHDWAAEKRAALDAWAAHLVPIVQGRTAGDNVVTLARVG